jgi:hypothetical protein
VKSVKLTEDFLGLLQIILVLRGVIARVEDGLVGGFFLEQKKLQLCHILMI